MLILAGLFADTGTMVLLRRQLLDSILDLPKCALLVLLVGAGIVCKGQSSVGEGRLSDATVFVTVGGENSQYPDYADNSIGFDSGFSYQPRKLEGFEARVGSYPYGARFVQTPITAGYRVGTESVLGYPYAPFAYFGGGVSRMQDGGVTRASTPAFRPCWQADVGVDLLYARFSFRVVQISFRESYGAQTTVRSIGLSTGIVYRMKH